MHIICRLRNLVICALRNRNSNSVTIIAVTLVEAQSNLRNFVSGRASRNTFQFSTWSTIVASTTPFHASLLSLTSDGIFDKTVRGCVSTMPKRKIQKHNHPKKVQKFAHEDQFKNVEYYFENGLRKVKPYVYKFETHAKGRWFGCKLLDVFKKEFRLETPEYYQMAIKEGLIKVNKAAALPDRILKNNDFMQSKVHRHEPPVSGQPIQILEENDNYLVINKPASIPVHPCGKYRHNTLVFILGREYGYRGLHTIHRLDRLTSGLLLFARTLEVSHRLDAYVRNRQLEKTYISKVQGEFPSEAVECSEPIFVVSHKIGVCRVNADGKPCKTRFQRLSYDGNTSVVKCFPHTGRMHQIRVHLQYLGYPIANDPLYNNPVWGPEKGKGGLPELNDEQLLKDLIDQHDVEIDSALEKARLQILMNKTKGANLQLHNSDERCKTVSKVADGDVLNSSEEPGGRTKGEETVSESNTCEPSRAITVSCERTQGESGPSENPDLCSSRTLVMPDASQKDLPVDLQVSLNVHKRDNEVADPSSQGGANVCDGKSETKAVGCLAEGPAHDAACGTSMIDGTCEPLSKADDPTGGDSCLPSSSEGQVKNDTNTEHTACLDDTKTDNRLEDERTDELVVSLCRECRAPMPDPEPHEMCIYLHALTYKGPDFEFSAPMPSWALDHFDRTGANFSDQI